MKLKGRDMPPGGPPVSVIGCISSSGTQICIVKGENIIGVSVLDL